MKSGKRIAALSALALACAPVVAQAATLFADDFDAGTSASRYDTYGLDTGGGTDYRAIFNFNYSNFHYWHIAADQSTQNAVDLIPQAPRSGGAAKVGLLMDANNNAISTLAAQLDVIPKLAQYAGGVVPSGNYTLTVDVFADYNGRFQGGGGSTEFLKMGINQLGGGIGGLLQTGTSPNNAGQAIAISGEGQNGLDYRQYRGNSRLPELDAGAGFVAVDEGSGNPGPSGSENAYYQPVFPFTNPSNATENWYETPGSVGKHWTTIQLKYEDGIVYEYAKPAGAADYTLIAARSDTTATAGHILLGYADTIGGIAEMEHGTGNDLNVDDIDPAPSPNGDNDANFVLFDNVSVDTITQVRQKWNVNTGGNWTDTTKWQAGDDADGLAELADFTTALSSAQTVALDSSRTVRALKFDSTSAGYTISGANTLTLDSLTPGIRTRVQAVTGNHVVSTPVITNKPITFDVAAGATVKLTDLTVNIVPNAALQQQTAMVVEKLGSGTAEVNRLMLTGTNAGVTVSGGVLKITANGTATGVSRMINLTIAAGAKLDLTDNHLITPAAAGTWNGSAYTGVTGLVKSAKGTGNTWNGTTGITTSQSAAQGTNFTTLGVAKASDIRPNTATETGTWAGQTITGTDTLVMYTYGGDANLDGKLNIDDYVRIDQGIAGGMTGWANGDFNYDGKINIDDYTTVIDSNIGNQTGTFFSGGAVGGSSGVTAVPEPVGAAAIALGVAALARRKRRA